MHFKKDSAGELAHESNIHYHFNWTSNSAGDLDFWSKHIFRLLKKLKRIRFQHLHNVMLNELNAKLSRCCN